MKQTNGLVVLDGMGTLPRVPDLRPSRIPFFTYSYGLDEQGKPVAHRITVLRNWGRVDFDSGDGRHFAPSVAGVPIVHSAVLAILGCETDVQFLEIIAGLQDGMRQAFAEMAARSEEKIEVAL